MCFKKRKEKKWGERGTCIPTLLPVSRLDFELKLTDIPRVCQVQKQITLSFLTSHCPSLSLCLQHDLASQPGRVLRLHSCATKLESQRCCCRLHLLPVS